MYRLERLVVPTYVHKPQKTLKWLQNEGENSKKRPLFVEGVFWLNFGVLIGCAPKKDKNPKKVSFHAQNRQKSNPTRVGLGTCTETGQNVVSKQTTEEGQRGNPGLSLFENQKNSCSTMSWSAVQKSKNAHVSSGKVYIIVDQNGLFSWLWCTNFSFLSL